MHLVLKQILLQLFLLHRRPLHLLRRRLLRRRLHHQKLVPFLHPYLHPCPFLARHHPRQMLLQTQFLTRLSLGHLGSHRILRHRILLLVQFLHHLRRFRPVLLDQPRYHELFLQKPRVGGPKLLLRHHLQETQ